MLPSGLLGNLFNLPQVPPDHFAMWNADLLLLRCSLLRSLSSYGTSLLPRGAHCQPKPHPPRPHPPASRRQPTETLGFQKDRSFPSELQGDAPSSALEAEVPVLSSWANDISCANSVNKGRKGGGTETSGLITGSGEMCNISQAQKGVLPLGPVLFNVSFPVKLRIELKQRGLGYWKDEIFLRELGSAITCLILTSRTLQPHS